MCVFWQSKAQRGRGICIKCLSKCHTKLETNHLLEMSYFLEDKERVLIKVCVLLLKEKFHGSAHAH